MQYTLVGFSADIDWRPLCFLRPLPPNRVCGACGLVRPKTALLPCGHTLCEPCYEQCVHEGLHVCPIDCYECQDEDVDWREFPVDELLRREVKCWNQESGCSHVTAASGIAKHFRCECEHHSVRCPKCSATVLCSGVIAHLKSGFCSSATVVASDCEQQSEFKNEKAFLTLFRGGIEKQAAEVKEFMAGVVGSIKTHGDGLNEISHGINSSKETLRQGLADVTKQNNESLAQIMCEMNAFNKQIEFWSASIDALNVTGRMARLERTLKDELANVAKESKEKLSQVTTAIEGAKANGIENSQKALDHLENIVRHVELGVAHCVFFVKNVKSLQESAEKEGYASYQSEKVYLRGYCISPGIGLERVNESMTLHTRLRLHKGCMDDIVQWPFEQRIRLSVIHPKAGTEQVVESKTFRCFESCKKPTAENTTFARLNKGKLNFTGLLTDSYVEDDQMRIKFELFV